MHLLTPCHQTPVQHPKREGSKSHVRQRDT